MKITNKNENEQTNINATVEAGNTLAITENGDVVETLSFEVPEGKVLHLSLNINIRDADQAGPM